MTQLRKHPEWGIAAIFVVLGVFYSLSTPIFEASDEIFHYPVVEHITSTGRLPVQDAAVETMWEQEGSQPPLYYLLAAGLTYPIDTSDLEMVRWLNPHAKLGVPLDPDNKNMIIHRASERFPWSGTVLAVHIIRLFGIALGTATVLGTYHIAQLCFPSRKNVWLLATCLVAFNPMFLFISASVNNDNLAVFLSTYSFYLQVLIVRDGLTNKRIALLSLILALAALTKISGLTLLPISGFVLLVNGWKTKDWKGSIAALAIIALVCTAIAGWWYLRNFHLYGEFLGLDTMVAIAGPREISLWELRREWHGFWLAFWGLFGAVNILLPEGFYSWYTILSLGGIVGLIAYLRKILPNAQARVTAYLALGMLAQIGIVFVGVIRWTSTTYASQGRLMFPTISLVGILIAIGLLEVIPANLRSQGMRLANVSVLLLAMLSPILVIKPAYGTISTVEDVPEDALKPAVEYDGLELAGIVVHRGSRLLHDRIPVTLYWRAASEIGDDLSIYLHATGRSHEQVGKIDTYPAGGMMPTSMMSPGTIYEDRYFVAVDERADLPSLIQIEIGVGRLTDSTYEIIKPVNSQGDVISNTLVDAGVTFPQDRQTCQRDPADTEVLVGTLDDYGRVWIQDTHYQSAPGGETSVTLIWESLSPASSSLTAFVHVVGNQPQPVAQADGPPVGGAYPTDLWTYPCRVTDSRTINLPGDLPVGQYTLLVGMYDPADSGLTRTVLLNPDGVPYPNNAAPAATIEIGNP